MGKSRKQTKTETEREPKSKPSGGPKRRRKKKRDRFGPQGPDLLAELEVRSKNAEKVIRAKAKEYGLYRQDMTTGELRIAIINFESTPDWQQVLKDRKDKRDEQERRARERAIKEETDRRRAQMRRVAQTTVPTSATGKPIPPPPVVPPGGYRP